MTRKGKNRSAAPRRPLPQDARPRLCENVRRAQSVRAIVKRRAPARHGRPTPAAPPSAVRSPTRAQGRTERPGPGRAAQLRQAQAAIAKPAPSSPTRSTSARRSKYDNPLPAARYVLQILAERGVPMPFAARRRARHRPARARLLRPSPARDGARWPGRAQPPRGLPAAGQRPISSRAASGPPRRLRLPCVATTESPMSFSAPGDARGAARRPRDGAHLGTDRRGRPKASWSRCSSAPTPGWSVASSPSMA